MIKYERKVNVKMPEGIRPRVVQSIIEEKFANINDFHAWYKTNVGNINDAVKVSVTGVAMGLTRVSFTTESGEKDCYLNDCRV